MRSSSSLIVRAPLGYPVSVWWLAGVTLGCLHHTVQGSSHRTQGNPGQRGCAPIRRVFDAKTNSKILSRLLKVDVADLSDIFITSLITSLQNKQGPPRSFMDQGQVSISKCRVGNPDNVFELQQTHSLLIFSI